MEKYSRWPFIKGKQLFDVITNIGVGVIHDSDELVADGKAGVLHGTLIAFVTLIGCNVPGAAYNGDFPMAGINKLPHRLIGGSGVVDYHCIADIGVQLAVKKAPAGYGICQKSCL